MKRHYYFLLMMLAMGVVSCDFSAKQKTDNNTTVVDSQEMVVDSSDIAIPEQTPTDLSECDMAMLDKGKLFFYNSEKQILMPYEAETDSVVNSVFVGDKLYYCVPENGKIVLKSIQLDVPDAQPVKEVDWGLDFEKCVTETYETVSPLCYYAGRNMLGLWHEFSWESYSLSEQKLFNLDTKEITDWNWEEWEQEELAQQNHEGEEQTEENYTFDPVKDELKDYLIQKEDGNYWFVDGIEHVCLTDKIDFNAYLSDPSYASEREFNYLSSSPDNLKVLYMAILEWGDYPHGPLCVSSIDGTYQVALEDTDCSDYKAQWLSDGSLVYVGYERIGPDEGISKWDNCVPVVKRVYPDGTWESFFRGNDFQLRMP